MGFPASTFAEHKETSLGAGFSEVSAARVLLPIYERVLNR